MRKLVPNSDFGYSSAQIRIMCRSEVQKPIEYISLQDEIQKKGYTRMISYSQ